jgi:hypothetical protein
MYGEGVNLILKYIYDNRNNVLFRTYGHEMTYQTFKALGMYAMTYFGVIVKRLHGRTAWEWEPTLSTPSAATVGRAGGEYSRAIYQAIMLMDGAGPTKYSRPSNFKEPDELSRYDSSFSLGVIETTLGLPTDFLSIPTIIGVHAYVYSAVGATYMRTVYRSETISS